MAVAFTFPGQGSQAVGMGKALAEQFAEARAVFEEVDAALGEKLSATMFEGPEDVLTLTANAQPALMAVSIATARVMEARGFSLKDKVAYGGQLVISGSKAAVELAASLASEKGAKRAIMLPVSAPFHSTLMAPAAEAMREALAQVEKHNPIVPLIANVRAAPVTDANEIADLLVEQVTGQVRWRETVEWFAANGVTTLYEVGSGKVLTGLARRISKDVTGVTVGSAEEIDAALAALNA